MLKLLVISKYYVLILVITSLMFSGCGEETVITPDVVATSTNSEANENEGTVVSSDTYVSFPGIANLVDRVSPGIVSIQAKMVQQTFFGPIEGVSSGSGVIFRSDGYILTNNHVVEGAKEILVTSYDGQDSSAKIIGTDVRTDLAVIKIDENDLYALKVGSVDKIRPGQWVVAIGNALGLEGSPSVTTGVVSALDRTLYTDGITMYDLIQTDAAINKGNSGGPLINFNGELIGINTAGLRGDTQGIGFAISIGTALPVATHIIEYGEVRRPYLGIQGSSVNRAVSAELGLSVRSGVLITDVLADGPADLSGILARDVIVDIVRDNEKHSITDLAILQKVLLGKFKVGDTVKVVVYRGDQVLEFNVILSKYPGK